MIFAADSAEGAKTAIPELPLLRPDEKLSAEGHFLFPEKDFRLQLAWEKTDAGFVRGGFETWRRYYDDTGGFYRPFTPPSLCKSISNPTQSSRMPAFLMSSSMALIT